MKEPQVLTVCQVLRAELESLETLATRDLLAHLDHLYVCVCYIMVVVK